MKGRQDGRKVGEVRWCSLPFARTLTAAAKWAHLYSPTLPMAHDLNAHRMAAVSGRTQCDGNL